jgi:hypothetical protein
MTNATLTTDTATRIARLRVHGLGYGPAVETIAMALAEVPGVRSAKVVAGASLAHVECGREVSGEALLATLRRVGFRGEVVSSN